MHRPNCVSFLLLLAVLLAALWSSPVVVATARREMRAATVGDEGRGYAGAANSLTNAPEAAAAAKDGGQEVNGIRTRKDEVVVVRSHRRFRSRKIPASASPHHQVYFGGRIPFTADYHSVHRHPPTHN